MRTLLLAALLCLAVAPAHAWGPRGHRLVGHLAQAQLTDAARAEAKRLLAGEKEPSLAGVSTWADELRGSDPELGRSSAPWHYVNIGENHCRYERDTHCPDGDCVVEAINDQALILADRSRSDAERLQALKFLVHFVGDVHQPMHAGYGRDRGGNTYQVSLRGDGGDSQGTNLHALWDSGLFRGLRDEEAHLARLAQLPASGTTALDAAGWAEESCALALAPGVYPDGHIVGQDYVEAWRPRAEERIALAGRRLAVLLNDLLAPADAQ